MISVVLEYIDLQPYMLAIMLDALILATYYTQNYACING